MFSNVHKYTPKRAQPHMPATTTTNQELGKRRKKKCRLFSWRAWDTPDGMLKARKLYIKQHPKPVSTKSAPKHDNDMDESD
ncbi:hypothetical protein BASA81_005845 [Batrachochytrium salamandrivorans]|nr:hypothetical protein BASA81_005845 [Batrachochytrium salamandrivorans]